MNESKLLFQTVILALDDCDPFLAIKHSAELQMNCAAKGEVLLDQR